MGAEQSLKLVMTLLVRDEEDIIRDNIEFHLAQGVDFIIATDNLSVDSTTEILRSYESQGVLHYILEEQDNYNQHAWVTRMARMACTDFGADWVINNDADEFWWPERGDLKSVFSGVTAEVNVIRAQRSNFVVVENRGLPFHQRMIYRERQSLNPVGKPLPPKVAHCASENINVHQGNHSVEGFDEQIVHEGGIDIFHFPIRSLAQIENKIIKGGAAYDRNTELSRNVGITWRSLYRDLQKNSGLSDYFRQHFFPPKRLNQALESGELIPDTRLRNFMKSLGAARQETPVHDS